MLPASVGVIPHLGNAPDAAAGHLVVLDDAVAGRHEAGHLKGLLKEEKVRTSEKCCPDSRRGQEAAS